MKKTFVIFIPGLFGSSLQKGNDEVWPLQINTKINLYYDMYIKRMMKAFIGKKKEHPEEPDDSIAEYASILSDKNLISGKILDNYDNIIDLIKDKTNKSYHLFSYDWRQDFDTITDKFDKEIEALEIQEENITIVSHSAGGIIAYKYINDEKYTKGRNHSKVEKYISIGCPIQGSVKALSVILGLCHQNKIPCDQLKYLIDEINIKPLFQLIPSNIHNIFISKDNKHILPERILNVLINNGFDETKLNNAIDFRNKFNNLSHNDKIDYLFVCGTHNKSNLCNEFVIDEEDNSILPEYSNSCSDGSVLTCESIPDISKKFRIKFVNGKHQYLTEYDSTLEIISKELDNVENDRLFIISETVELPSEKSGKLKFKLFLIKNRNKYPVKDLKAEEIIFTQKTKSSNVTEEFKKSKKNNIFQFKTKLHFGLLKMKNVIVTYDNFKNVNFTEYDSEKEDNSLKTIMLKYQYIEIEKSQNLFSF